MKEREDGCEIHTHAHTYSKQPNPGRIRPLQGIVVIILEANVTVKKRISSIFSFYKHAPNANQAQLRVFLHHCRLSNSSAYLKSCYTS